MSSICHLPIYDPQKCSFFALGRNAMVAACQAFRLQSGDEVLTPAFDCDTTLQPFRGLRLRFFRSDPYTFQVDVNDLRRRLTSKTKLIHVIHHFGFPQPWEELLSLRQEFGIPILEDNAYSLFSMYRGKHFGTFGDISIFSLRKNLSLIDGGLLRINNAKYSIFFEQKNAPWIYKTELSSALRLLKTKLKIKRFPLLKKTFVPPTLYSHVDADIPLWFLRDHIGRDFSQDYLRPMSKLARYQLSMCSLEKYKKIISRKRQQYLFLVKALSPMKHIKILWPNLEEGIVPFNFSFLVFQDRDVLLKKLQKKYPVMVWPTLSQLVLDQLEDFPDVQFLGRNLLQYNFSGQEEDFVKDLIHHWG